MILSLIIPVYNVERYLSRCLESCLKQDVDDYELVLINDGSPDHSLSIIREYAEKYPRIRYITQENQGLSMSRNNGLKLARGEYVWFIDSDDTITGNCIHDILAALSRGCDMLQLNYQKTYEDGKEPMPYLNSYKKDDCYSGKYIICHGGLPAPAQFTIYRRQFLIENNLTFVPGIYHEDSEFKPRAVYLAKTIRWHEPIVYNYLQRSIGSITSQFKLKNGIDLMTVNNNLHQFYKQNINEPECIAAFRRFIGLNTNSLLLGIQTLPRKDKLELMGRMRGQKHLFRDMLLSHKLKYAVEGCLLLISVRCAVLLYGILKR